MSSIFSDSWVDIANLALSHLAISNGIVSLDPPDATEQAKACAFHLPRIKKWLLQSAPWKFAYKYTTLTADGSSLPNTTYAFPGWPYAYQYPNDCLQPIAVTTYQGLRYGPVYWNNYWFPYAGLNRVIPKIPYEVIQSTASPGQLAIATDIYAPAYLFYIADVTNSALFDPMFTQALAGFLAHRIGGPLRADEQLRAQAQQMAEDLRLQALAQHMNAAQQDMERPSPSVMARW